MSGVCLLLSLKVPAIWREILFFGSALFARSQLTTATAIDANWPQSEELSPGARPNLMTNVSFTGTDTLSHLFHE